MSYDTSTFELNLTEIYTPICSVIDMKWDQQSVIPSLFANFQNQIIHVSRLI